MTERDRSFDIKSIFTTSCSPGQVYLLTGNFAKRFFCHTDKRNNAAPEEENICYLGSRRAGIKQINLQILFSHNVADLFLHPKNERLTSPFFEFCSED